MAYLCCSMNINWCYLFCDFRFDGSSQELMAVIVSSSQGWVLDHQTAISDPYIAVQCSQHTQLGGCDGTQKAFQCLPQLFDIWEPFLYNSQYEKVHSQDGSGLSADSGDQTNIPDKKGLPAGLARKVHLELSSLKGHIIL